MQSELDVDGGGGVPHEQAHISVAGCLAGHDAERTREIGQIIRVLDKVVGKRIWMKAAVGQPGHKRVMQDCRVGGHDIGP
ncbi:hypothetical protein MBOT_32170 [Mycobacterium botniense]|uniref:Uncharacterized protein n=1 Tax=Mycobacterium botniense TaxID=84962 RepID=A0A7I9Y197_9MYCO|nr:hypothetical protein MBOT_32170 [Mycobacterium botniense]